MGPGSAVGNPVATLALGRGRLIAAIVGLELWLVSLLVLPAPTIERIFLAAPLVIVPALLGLLPSRRLGRHVDITDLAPWAALLAAYRCWPPWRSLPACRLSP